MLFISIISYVNENSETLDTVSESITMGARNLLCTMQVCDVITTDMPDVCVSKKPAPAYKYSNEGGCYILGDLMKSYAVN